MLEGIQVGIVGLAAPCSLVQLAGGGLDVELHETTQSNELKPFRKEIQ